VIPKRKKANDRKKIGKKDFNKNQPEIMCVRQGGSGWGKETVAMRYIYSPI